jgi:hypothetical protein
MTRHARVALAGVVAVGLVLAGCSEGSSDQTSERSQPAEADVPTGGEEAQEAGDEAGGGAGEGDSALAVDAVALAAEREVIRTGNVLMTVDDVESAAGDIHRIAEGAGGFVADEQFRASSSDADVTVRVPADEFETVRGRIAELGEVAEQDIQAQDVTAEMVDLETRIASMRASVERLQGLLGRAGDVTQLASVEGELAARETELESLLGQQRVLSDQVALGTLTVHLSEDEEPRPDEDAAGFTDGFQTGWAAAIDGGRAGLAALGFLLPFLVPLALVGLVVQQAIARLSRGRVVGR